MNLTYSSLDSLCRERAENEGLESVADLEDLLLNALESIHFLIPFDLATIMELVGDELRVRLACGAINEPRIKHHRLALRKAPSIRAILDSGHARAFLEEDHDAEGDPFDGILDLPHGHACMVVPLTLGGRPLGIITFDRRVCGPYSPEVTRLADTYGQLVAITLKYARQNTRLQQLCSASLEKIRMLRENRGHHSRDPRDLVADCPSSAMKRVRLMAEKVAASRSTVLITGQTGVGKGVLARAIHHWSPRAEKPLVEVNCGAIPSHLLESELFGHTAGAFTGAAGKRLGRFARAEGGTLFLDEVGELPAEVQVKLLRILQEGVYEPLGTSETRKADVRIIAATNVDLSQAIAANRFREDLYYRLAVFPIEMPALEVRREDIPIIAAGFLADFAQKFNHGPWSLTAEQEALLQARDWPGNVRQLTNFLERAAILSEGPYLDFDDPALPRGLVRHKAAPDAAEVFPTLEAMERAHIEKALQRTGGKVYGDGGAAVLLGLNANTLRSRMRKLGLGGARDHHKSRGDQVAAEETGP